VSLADHLKREFLVQACTGLLSVGAVPKKDKKFQFFWFTNSMQYAKDSFYMALLQRLVALNPAQTVTVNGVTRPALIVAENELVVPVVPVPDAFYIEWGAAQVVQRQMNSRALFAMECVISYHTYGTVQSGVDRGRALAALDMELMAICQPPWTAKQDFTQTPSVNLGSDVVWSIPALGKVAGSEAPTQEGLPRGTEGVRLERIASLKVFFFSEVTFL
jgi:hypothetical protein